MQIFQLGRVALGEIIVNLAAAVPNSEYKLNQAANEITHLSSHFRAVILRSFLEKKQLF